MAKSLCKVLDSNIAKKVAEKREIAAAKHQSDCDKLLGWLEDEFTQLLNSASEFETIYFDQVKTAQLYKPDLSVWVEDLGFSILKKDIYRFNYELTIPEFTSGEGKKMTIAQTRLRAFNAALKARKKQLRANAKALCKEFTQKIIDGEFVLEDDEKTITVTHVRPDGKALTDYERVYIANFFAKRKIQFEVSCSVPDTYRFYHR